MYGSLQGVCSTGVHVPHCYACPCREWWPDTLHGTAACIWLRAELAFFFSFFLSNGDVRALVCVVFRALLVFVFVWFLFFVLKYFFRGMC